MLLQKAVPNRPLANEDQKQKKPSSHIYSTDYAKKDLEAQKNLINERLMHTAHVWKQQEGNPILKVNPENFPFSRKMHLSDSLCIQ